MDTTKLCDRLKETTYVVNCYDDGELFSVGSAVCLDSSGTLMTAAHVISNRLPPKEGDKDDPNLRVFARTRGGGFFEYKTKMLGITIHYPNVLRKPLVVDLAVLRPIDQRSNAPHIDVAPSHPVLGTRVLMAGFPDEVEMPLSIDRALNLKHPPVRARLDQVLRDLEHSRQLLMMKSGMIGHEDTLIIDDGKGTRLDVGIFYIDNGMHSGASGGPVIDHKGELIGIVTTRAVTTIDTQANPDKIEVPSGSTLAVSPLAAIQWIAKHALEQLPGLFPFTSQGGSLHSF